MSWLAVGVGATLGAWLRWWLGLWMNAANPHLPYGTLLANCGGGFLIGLALALFQHVPGLAPEWRLLTITGFLGGLTTFSTFSAESMSLLQRGDYMWAIAHTLTHVIGALACCFAGHAAMRSLLA